MFAFMQIDLQGVIPEGLLAQQGLQKLVSFFLFGAVAFLLRDRIPYSPALAIGCAAILLVFGFIGNGDWSNDPLWVVLSAPLLTYLMAFVGVTKLPTVPFFNRGDYSYGIYLYGFPVQQTMVHFFGIESILALFVVSMPVIVLFAVMSWHLVEKPTLALRKNFSMAAKMERARQRGDT